MAEFCIFNRPALISAKKDIVYNWANAIVREIEKSETKSANHLVEDILQLSKNMGIPVALETSSVDSSYDENIYDCYEIHLENLNTRKNIILIDEDDSGITETIENFRDLAEYYESGCNGENSLALCVSHSLQLVENRKKGYDLIAFTPIAARCMSMISEEELILFQEQDFSDYRPTLFTFNAPSDNHWKSYLRNPDIKRSLYKNRIEISIGGLQKSEAGALGYASFKENYDVIGVATQKHKSATLRGSHLTFEGLPSSVLFALEGKPLEEVLSSPMTDGLGVTIGKIIENRIQSQMTTVELQFKGGHEIVKIERQADVQK